MTGVDLLVLLLAGVIALDLVATIVVSRDAESARRQKILQLVLIWALPVIGAIVCLVAGLAHRRAYRKRSEEFADNADASGDGD